VISHKGPRRKRFIYAIAIGTPQDMRWRRRACVPTCMGENH